MMLMMIMMMTCIARFEQVSVGRLYVEPTWRSWLGFFEEVLTLQSLYTPVEWKWDLRILMILKIWAILLIWLSYITSSPPLLPAFANISKTKCLIKDYDVGLLQYVKPVNLVVKRKWWKEDVIKGSKGLKKKFSSKKQKNFSGIEQKVSLKEVIVCDVSICWNRHLRRLFGSILLTRQNPTWFFPPFGSKTGQ